MPSPDHAVIIADGVYTIQNKASGTYFDLKDGSTNNETPIVGYEDLNSKSNYLNQNWLIKRVPNTKFFIITNVTSNTVVDLYTTDPTDGTRIQGFGFHGGPNQQWYFLDGGNQTLSIISSATNKAIDLQNGGKANDTKVQEWTYIPNDNQRWNFRSRNVSVESIQRLLTTGHWATQPFNFYSNTRFWIVPPTQAVEETFAKGGLGNDKLRPESFDRDSFANAFKGDITYWAYDNVRAPVGILFGTLWNGPPSGRNACNWTLTDDLTHVKFWDPQHGQWASSVDPANFGVL